MNDSGPGVAGACRSFAQRHGKPELVILHDNMEHAFGTAKITRGAGKSAKGHNGLKSILEQSSLRTLESTRVGIGIGPRPESRKSGDVARFVLKRMDQRQMGLLEDLAGPVWRALEEGRIGTVTADKGRKNKARGKAG